MPEPPKVKMCSVCEKESPADATECSFCKIDFESVSLIDKILDAREKRKEAERKKNEPAPRKGLLHNLSKAVKK